MPEYLSPGVYVEEVDRGAKPIEAVGTAMPVFIGFSEKAELREEVNGEIQTENLLNKPQLVTNWSQYVERFGDFVDGAYLPQSVYGYFLNGGSRCYVLSVKTIPPAQTTLLGTDGNPYLVVQAKQAGFSGMRLRVSVDVAGELPAPGENGDGGNGAVDVDAEELPPFNVTVERETQTGGWQTKEVFRDVRLTEVEEDGETKVKVAFRSSKSSDWVNIFAPETDKPLATVWPREQSQSLNIETNLLSAPEASDFQGDVAERTGVEGLEALDDATMVVIPDLMTPMPGEDLDLDMVKAVQTMAIAHCEKMGDRVAILDTPPNLKPMDAKKWRMDTTGFDSSYAALYYPWIEIMNPATNRSEHIPPSGYLAGIWARSDSTRGVHKAPANEVVQGATGLAYNVTKGEQDVLNPIGVNCIRAFPGMGIRVWGARTLSSNPSWRYINVRRLFNMIKKSIERGTQWVVFEPNEPTLWARVRRDITAFLTTVWSEGALFGSSPNEAFYVKCDEELNPPESRDLGRLIVEIGISPVKPAEFVIFRISQWSAE